MSKSLRLSERWFNLGLWLVALIFAGFLIGLGSTVIEKLPQVERQHLLEDFVDQGAARQARETLSAAQNQERSAADALEQAQLKRTAAQASGKSARDSFDNWLATRRATQRPDQDAELIARTRVLDDLKAAERQAERGVEAQQQSALDATQAARTQQRRMAEIEQAGQERLAAAVRRQELRVFGYRLALTLPLLVIAVLLFRHKRKSVHWPFVWGFIFFALFAFFVELVPYLPSYGGFVRYVVGIVITVLVGRQAVIALNRYLERQRLAESLPDVQRREELSYDTALTRLDKGVCPGCERPVDLKDERNDFCPHCGICLHDRCTNCATRKNAFAKFCFSCGTPASVQPV